MDVPPATWNALSRFLDEAFDLEPDAREPWLERLGVVTRSGLRLRPGHSAAGGSPRAGRAGPFPGVAVRPEPQSRVDPWRWTRVRSGAPRSARASVSAALTEVAEAEGISTPQAGPTRPPSRQPRLVFLG